VSFVYIFNAGRKKMKVVYIEEPGKIEL